MARYSIGDGTFAINRDDNLLFDYFLEGKPHEIRCIALQKQCVPADNTHCNNELVDIIIIVIFIAGSLRTESAEARKFNFDFIQNESGTDALHCCDNIHYITYPIHCVDFYTKSVAEEPGDGPN